MADKTAKATRDFFLILCILFHERFRGNTEIVVPIN